MNLREYLLEQTCLHFNVSPSCNHVQILSRPEFNPFPSVLNEKTMEKYIIYDIPSSFQFNILDYRKDIATSITFDSQFELYYRETPNDIFTGSPYKQNFYKLIYIVDGQLDITLEGKHHCLTSSSICITNRNVRQEEGRSTEFTAIYLCFKPEFIESFSIFKTKPKNIGTELLDFYKINQANSEQIDYLIFQPINNIPSTVVEKTITLLFNELLKKEYGYLDICKFYLQRLFYSMQQPSEYLCFHTHFSQIQEETVFEQTLKYIIDAKRKLSRDEIGEALNYNGNYISRVFQKHTGQTLARYIRDICLSHAAHLLLNSDLQIREIVELIGYENKTVFYKNFKEKYGMNPGQYRALQKHDR